MSLIVHIPRRKFLSTLAASAAAFYVPGAFADELERTPAQTEGPFYPNKMPLDTDNDLIVISNSLTPAIGEITHLRGKILDASGTPVKNAQVEIWQVDAKGVYIHTKDSDGKARDTNFQGFGRFETSSTGEYYFRTVKPVPYPGRAPHIHFKVKKSDKELLTTQCYIKGHEGNAKDGIYRSLKTDKAKAALTVDFAPIKDSKVGELNANFDIVLDAK
jgi:protocatechuate 3,4-dioxygenase, beta subunit